MLSLTCQEIVGYLLMCANDFRNALSMLVAVCVCVFSEEHFYSVALCVTIIDTVT